METLTKIKATLFAAPIGAAVGGFIGYYVAKKTQYDKTLMVVSFVMVGTIIGASFGTIVGKKSSAV